MTPQIRLLHLAAMLALAQFGVMAAPVSELPPPATFRQGEISVQAADLQHPAFFLWLPGSMGWPNLRLDTARPLAKQPKTFKTLELSNRYLTARFTPEVGLRLYDLTWNDDPLKRQPFGRLESLHVSRMYQWEGPGYHVDFGAMKWGFPAYGHTYSDHLPWHSEGGVTPQGDAWLKGDYSDLETGLKGTLAVRLPRDAARLEFTFTLHNPTPKKLAFDYWIDSMVPVSPNLEFMLPAEEIITHQNAWGYSRQMFCAWPFFQGKDLRFFAQWGGSQGIFPSLHTHGFSGFYDHARQAGIVRTFSQDKVHGTKFWLPDVGDTNSFGEMFSGIDVTHDERRFLEAGATYCWQESWYPVRDLGGMDAATTQVALRLEVQPDGSNLRLIAAQPLQNVAVTLTLSEPATTLLNTQVDLAPGAPRSIPFAGLTPAATANLTVTLTPQLPAAPLTYTIPARQLKPAYNSATLKHARQDYDASLTVAPPAPAPETRPDATVPATPGKPTPAPVTQQTTFMFEHRGKLGMDASTRLRFPAAACVLADGNLLIADACKLMRVSADLTPLQTLETEPLNWPLGLCAQGDDVWVADSGNQRLLRLNPKTGETLASIPLPERPAGIALWRGGLAIALPRLGGVVSLPLPVPPGSVPTPIAVGMPLRHPFGLLADGDTLFIADPGLGQVIRVSATGTTSLPAPAEGYAQPTRIAKLGTALHVLDAGRGQIFRIANDHAEAWVNGRLFGPVAIGLAGDLSTLGDQLVATITAPASLQRLSATGQVTATDDIKSPAWPDYEIRCMRGFCALPDGRWLISDLVQRVLLMSAEGKLIREYGAWGRGDSQFWEANRLAADAQGNVYISDFFNYRILRFAADGQARPSIQETGVGTDGVPRPETWYVRDLLVDRAGRLWVAAAGSGRVTIFSPAPENRPLLTITIAERFHPNGLAQDEAGHLFVLDDAAAAVFVFDLADIEARLQKQTTTAPPPIVTLVPARWSIPAESCANAIAADGRGGCFLAFANERIPGSLARSLYHLDSQGKHDRSFFSEQINVVQKLRLHNGKLLLLNRYGGLNEVIFDPPPGKDGKVPDIALKRLASAPRPPLNAGEIQSPAAVTRLCLNNVESLAVFDRKAWRRLLFDPATLRFVSEENSQFLSDLATRSPDGQIALIDCDRPDQVLLDPHDGSRRTVTFPGVERPNAVVRDAAGQTWIAALDPGNPRLLLLPADAAPDAAPLWSVPTGSGQPLGKIRHFAPRPDGNAWAADQTNGCLHLLSKTNGAILTSTPPGLLAAPVRLQILDDGRLLVCDAQRGMLLLSADGKHVENAVKNQPAATDFTDFYYDAPTRRLFTLCGSNVFWAEPGKF